LVSSQLRRYSVITVDPRGCSGSDNRFKNGAPFCIIAVTTPNERETIAPWLASFQRSGSLPNQ
jgi:hypothetical protein